MIEIYTGKNSFLSSNFSESFNEIIYTHPRNTFIFCGFRSSDQQISNNIQLLKYNIQRLKKDLKNIKQPYPSIIIFISAISVYDGGWNGYDYKHNILSGDYYSASKIISEKIINNFCNEKGITFYSLRIPGIVCKNSQRNFISRLRNSIINQNTIVVSSPENLFNNLICPSQVERSILSLVNKRPCQKIFNACSKNPISIASIIKLFESLIGKKAKISIGSFKAQRLIDDNDFNSLIEVNINVEDVIRLSI